MRVSTIGSINLLSEPDKREIYRRLIPAEIFSLFGIPPSCIDGENNALLKCKYPPGSTDVEMKLFHKADFMDPVLYGHLTDTLSGQIHVLLYILNDPNAPRFDVDRMPDGTPTKFGTCCRNLEAERAAMQAGLAPGQIRRGLRLLPVAIQAFEEFVISLGHELYFVEPLYYHNAINFERYGFAYQVGRKKVERIEAGFAENGSLRKRLDDSTPFRTPEAAQSIRLRSWAIHDGILGEPFKDITMYKRVGRTANVKTSTNCHW